VIVGSLFLRYWHQS